MFKLNHFARSFFTVVLVLSVSVQSFAFGGNLCKRVVKSELTGAQLVEQADKRAQYKFNRFIKLRHSGFLKTLLQPRSAYDNFSSLLSWLPTVHPFSAISKAWFDLREGRLRKHMRNYMLDKKRYNSAYGDVRVDSFYFLSKEFRERRALLEKKLETAENSTEQALIVGKIDRIDQSLEKFKSDMSEAIEHYKNHKARVENAIRTQVTSNLRYRLLKLYIPVLEKALKEEAALLEASSSQEDVERLFPRDIELPYVSADGKVTVSKTNFKGISELRSEMNEAETEKNIYDSLAFGGRSDEAIPDLENHLAVLQYKLETYKDALKAAHLDNTDEVFKQHYETLRDIFNDNDTSNKPTSKAMVYSLKRSIKTEWANSRHKGNTEFLGLLRNRLMKVSQETLTAEQIVELVGRAGFRSYTPRFRKVTAPIFGVVNTVRARAGITFSILAISWVGIFWEQSLNFVEDRTGFRPFSDAIVRSEVETPAGVQEMIELSQSANFDQEYADTIRDRFPSVAEGIEKGDLSGVAPAEMKAFQEYTGEVLFSQLVYEIENSEALAQADGVSEADMDLADVVAAEESLNAAEVYADVINVVGAPISQQGAEKLVQLVDDLGAELSNSEKRTVISWYLQTYSTAEALEGKIQPEALKLIEGIVELRTELAVYRRAGLGDEAIQAEAQRRIRRILVEINMNRR